MYYHCFSFLSCLRRPGPRYDNITSGFHRIGTYPFNPRAVLDNLPEFSEDDSSGSVILYNQMAMAAGSNPPS